MKRILRLSLYALLFSSIMMPACGKDKVEVVNPVLTADDYNELAWADFESSPPDYSAAAENFVLALELEAANVEALTGLGWCSALMAEGPGDIRYADAKGYFVSATAIDIAYADAVAGLALVRFVLNEYDAAISLAAQMVNIDPDYVFRHKTDITIADLHLLRAQAYFYQGLYSLVVTILDDLDPGTEHPVDKPEILLVQIQNLWGVI